MSKGEYNKIKRYVQLDQILRESEGHTLKEILSKISDDISKRQLQDDLSRIESEFGGKMANPNIFYRGKERLWRYDDLEFSIFKTVNNEMEVLSQSIEKLKAFQGDPRYDMVRFSLLQLKNGIEKIDTPIMSFQYNPDFVGLEHLESLADAIIYKYPIKLTYKPYNRSSFVVHVHPYHLRQHNNRWVLFGWTEEQKCIHNYPLDRIQSIEHLSKKYLPSNINFDDYFDDIIGTTNIAKNEVEKIVIRVDRRKLDYIITKPLHWSQTILKETETETTIDIQIKVKQNIELEHLILSYGNELEVIMPQNLREKIATIINELSLKYKV